MLPVAAAWCIGAEPEGRTCGVACVQAHNHSVPATQQNQAADVDNRRRGRKQSSVNVNSVMATFRLWVLASAASLALAGGCDRSDARIDLTRYVSIDPGRPIIDLHSGTASLKIKVRNVHHLALRDLQLSIVSEACTAKVSPDAVDRLIPAQRTTFAVNLEANKQSKSRRYRLELTLRATGLPVPAGLDLLVDLRRPSDQGWIDVGQVKLVRASPARRTGYYLLAGIPLLLMVGWLIWRARRTRRRASPISPFPPRKKN